MHGVNLDLLRATAAHQLDGRPKDRHAHHRHELLALREDKRRARWAARLQALLARLHLKRSASKLASPGPASCS